MLMRWGAARLLQWCSRESRDALSMIAFGVMKRRYPTIRDLRRLASQATILSIFKVRAHHARVLCLDAFLQHVPCACVSHPARRFNMFCLGSQHRRPTKRRSMYHLRTPSEWDAPMEEQETQHRLPTTTSSFDDMFHMPHQRYSLHILIQRQACDLGWLSAGI